MKKLLLLALLVSCEGRCKARDAGVDVLGPATDCRGMSDQGLYCVRGNELWACSADGVFHFTAACERVGYLNTHAESP